MTDEDRTRLLHLLLEAEQEVLRMPDKQELLEEVRWLKEILEGGEETDKSFE